jgi:hypothetical protein
MKIGDNEADLKSELNAIKCISFFVVVMLFVSWESRDPFWKLWNLASLWFLYSISSFYSLKLYCCFVYYILLYKYYTYRPRRFDDDDDDFIIIMSRTINEIKSIDLQHTFFILLKQNLLSSPWSCKRTQ